jgi:hypothetical protein
MTPAALAPEAVLCACYRDQAERYREAIAIAESLPALLRAGEEHVERLDQVMRLLAEVADAEEEVRTVKEQWVRGGGRLGDELRAVLIEVTHLVERLARSLAAAEQEAAARQAELAPQIDGVIRSRAMRRAYRFA